MLKHYLGNLLRYGRVDPVEYYRCDEYRVVYIENAKVACSAIKQVLFGDVSHAGIGQENFHETLRNKARFRPPHGTQDYLYFTFIRDPAARLLSCYLDKIAGSAAHEGKNIFHLRSQRALFRHFGKIDITSPDLTFGQFARAVGKIPAPLRDRHIMPQSPMAAATSSAPNHFIGRYENLAADWAALSQLTGIAPLPSLNSSKARLVDPFSAQTIDAIQAAYAEDYARLEYPAPAMQK